MGSSAEGILTYGVSLGGEEEGWKIQGLDRWEEWRPSWLKPDEDDPKEYADADYVDSAMDALLASVGFTETNWQADGHFERKKDAEERLGVSFVSHGHHNFKQFIITTFHVSANQTQARGVDPDVIAAAPTELWDSRIQDALDVLGIKPVQEKPCWLLTASYG